MFPTIQSLLPGSVSQYESGKCLQHSNLNMSNSFLCVCVFPLVRDRRGPCQFVPVLFYDTFNFGNLRALQKERLVLILA